MPKLLTTPFAALAAPEHRTDIQNSTGESPNSATYQNGFPPITFQPLSSSGIPPKGADFNGVLYDITDNIVFLTQGGVYPYNAAYATTIGGYPLNARIALDNGDIVKNTIPANTNNPNVNMTGWAYSSLIPSKNLNDVPNKAAARTNLGVMSSSEVTTAIANATANTTLPNATETTAGKAKIATTAIARTGTNDTDIITAKKLRDALNAGGNAPVSASRAWVVFSATSGGVTILNSLNVSSVVRTATGKYTINFATPLPTANYAMMGLCPRSSTNSLNSVALDAGVTPTSTSVGIMVNNSGSTIDLDYVSFGVFC